MNVRRSVLAFLIGIVAVLPGTSRADAAKPGDCIRKDPIGGFCVEWQVDGGDSSPGGNGGGNGPPPICYWQNVPLITDPTIYADYGLPYPPDGAVIQWQTWLCSDGRVTDNWRWVFTVPPVDLAWSVRVRIEGRLDQPVIDASPPLGTPSIIGVPVFVAVSNWTGVVTDSGCGGGLCVTVTATPKLSFSPGESGSNSIACNGSGTKFNRSLPVPTQVSQPGACVYTYKLRTSAAGRPAEWPGAVTVTWSIAWTATSGDSGTLPSITHTSALPRGVQEVQTVVVGGNTP
jgi:hypothetical protein